MGILIISGRLGLDFLVYSMSNYSLEPLTYGEAASVAIFFLLSAAIIIPSLFFLAVDWINQRKQKRYLRGTKKEKWETYSGYFQRQQNPAVSNNNLKTYLDIHSARYK
jgi:hypothetical protein